MKFTPGDFGSLRGLFYEKRKVKSLALLAVKQFLVRSEL